MPRLSAYLLPTEREPPADAEATSHKLMVRAGLIRPDRAPIGTPEEYCPTGARLRASV